MPIPTGHSAYLFTMLPCRDLPNFISQVPGQLVRPFAPVRVSGMFLPQAASLSTCGGCLGVLLKLCPREGPPSLLFLGKTQRGLQCVPQASPFVNQALLFPPLFLQMIIKAPPSPLPCIHQTRITSGEVPV